MTHSDDSDRHTTIADLRQAVGRFVADRQWEVCHNPKNLAMGVAIEAAEIMEHFQWITVEEGAEVVKDPQKRAQVAEELADVVIYCLSFANQAEIDLSSAIRSKLKKNEGRYPAGRRSEGRGDGA